MNFNYSSYRYHDEVYTEKACGCPFSFNMYYTDGYGGRAEEMQAYWRERGLGCGNHPNVKGPLRKMTVTTLKQPQIPRSLIVSRREYSGNLLSYQK